MRRSSSRAMRTRIVCSARASRRRDPGCPPAVEQRAAGQLELGPEVVQMPLQRAVERDALADEPFAVIDQQPQIELGPVQCAAGKDSRPSCNAARATASASIGSDLPRWRALRRASAVRCVGIRNTRSPRPIRNRSRRPGDMPAVLKRPDPLAIQAARPPQQRIEPAPADLDGLLAPQLAGRRRDSGDRVRTLVSVRAKHDHGPRPPLILEGADTWRTRLAGGGATHLSSHARHPRPATSDKTEGSQALAPADSLKESQLAAGRDHPHGVGRHRRAESQQQASDSGSTPRTDHRPTTVRSRSVGLNPAAIRRRALCSRGEPSRAFILRPSRRASRASASRAPSRSRRRPGVTIALTRP